MPIFGADLVLMMIISASWQVRKFQPYRGGCVQARRSTGSAAQGRNRSSSGLASGLPRLLPQVSRQAVR